MPQTALRSAVPHDREDAYWRAQFFSRDYRIEGSDYEAYRPAYRYGADAYHQYDAQHFDVIEPELSGAWEAARGASPLDWGSARPAARDAYERLRRHMPHAIE
jgi:hypothetical protein